eukprot:gnl/Chilomastix_cuspidata/1761.p1 GENE.gnl/Chilomastix_cuspidata/1761~~gnl/Chilomastix_cuspidata/1761.p1  ORF type:complete len:706 (-),score=328.39 gnl/Chilomastix_cuspidata/1761:31-2148(-)
MKNISFERVCRKNKTMNPPRIYGIIREAMQYTLRDTLNPRSARRWAQKRVGAKRSMKGIWQPLVLKLERAKNRHRAAWRGMASTSASTNPSSDYPLVNTDVESNVTTPDASSITGSFGSSQSDSISLLLTPEGTNNQRSLSESSSSLEYIRELKFDEMKDDDICQFDKGARREIDPRRFFLPMLAVCALQLVGALFYNMRAASFPQNYIFLGRVLAALCLDLRALAAPTWKTVLDDEGEDGPAFLIQFALVVVLVALSAAPVAAYVAVGHPAARVEAHAPCPDRLRNLAARAGYTALVLLGVPVFYNTAKLFAGAFGAAPPSYVAHDVSLAVDSSLARVLRVVGACACALQLALAAGPLVRAEAWARRQNHIGAFADVVRVFETELGFGFSAEYRRRSGFLLSAHRFSTVPSLLLIVAFAAFAALAGAAEAGTAQSAALTAIAGATIVSIPVRPLRAPSLNIALVALPLVALFHALLLLMRATGVESSLTVSSAIFNELVLVDCVALALLVAAAVLAVARRARWEIPAALERRSDRTGRLAAMLQDVQDRAAQYARVPVEFVPRARAAELEATAERAVAICKTNNLEVFLPFATLVLAEARRFHHARKGFPEIPPDGVKRYWRLGGIVRAYDARWALLPQPTRALLLNGLFLSDVARCALVLGSPQTGYLLPSLLGPTPFLALPGEGDFTLSADSGADLADVPTE